MDFQALTKLIPGGFSFKDPIALVGGIVAAVAAIATAIGLAVSIPGLTANNQTPPPVADGPGFQTPPDPSTSGWAVGIMVTLNGGTLAETKAKVDPVIAAQGYTLVEGEQTNPNRYVATVKEGLSQPQFEKLKKALIDAGVTGQIDANTILTTAATG